MSWPAYARRWSGEDIAADVRAASEEFRGRRLAEPLARYLAAFDASAEPVGEVLSSLAGGARLSCFRTRDWATRLVRSRRSPRHSGFPSW